MSYHTNPDALLAQRETRICVFAAIIDRSGNHLPYFTITANILTRDTSTGAWHLTSAGTNHSAIRATFGPLYDPLIALHLSDINGVPMHAEANGWYWLTRHEPQILANHLRIPYLHAQFLIAWCAPYDLLTNRPHFAAYIEAQKPRWKLEADTARTLFPQLKIIKEGR